MGGRRLGQRNADRAAGAAPRRTARPGLRGAEGGPQPADVGAAAAARRGTASPPGRTGRGAGTAGPLWEDNDLVFAQPNGRPIERKSDWQAWKALLHEAGVREVRLHDGRHTAATLLLSEGVHPRVVMEVLGHAQMRTTTDTYSHVMPALGRDAADRMGNALWGPPAP
jgi:integrase